MAAVMGCICDDDIRNRRGRCSQLIVCDRGRACDPCRVVTDSTLMVCSTQIQTTMQKLECERQNAHERRMVVQRVTVVM